MTEGPKPELVERLGATYHTGDAAGASEEADIVVEATGATTVVVDVIRHTPANAVVCLTGVGSPGRRLDLAVGAIARELVLENDVVFGSVNANRRHYEQAGEALRAADRDWLSAVADPAGPARTVAGRLRARARRRQDAAGVRRFMRSWRERSRPPVA